MQILSCHIDTMILILLELGIPLHRVGYKQLCIAIPAFAANDTQTLSKELYPLVAAKLGYGDWRAVEHSIRDAIVYAWKRRDPAAWAKYFPSRRKPPSNKLFIATVATHIQQKNPLPGGRGRDCQEDLDSRIPNKIG